MSNLYITADKLVSQGTGGGIVTRNEYEALKSLGDTTLVSKSEVSADNPFLNDYLAEAYISELFCEKDNYSIAHFYSGCFSKTVEWLRNNYGTKVTYTAAAHDKNVSIEEFKGLGMEYPYQHISNDRLWKLYLKGYQYANIVICPSNLSKNLMLEYGCDNVIVIPHGIEPTNIIKAIPKRFTVGYLGQVGPDKGLRYLLAAWKKLKYKDATLLLAGSGTETLCNFIRIYGGGNIQVMGWVDSPSDLYNKVSCYVQPSTCEGFGIEIIEAMNHKRPVIASKGAGASEHINSDRGFTFNIRDVDTLCEQINYLKLNQEETFRMGENGYNYSLDMTWDKIKLQYANIWHNLLLPVMGQQRSVVNV